MKKIKKRGMDGILKDLERNKKKEREDEGGLSKIRSISWIKGVKRGIRGKSGIKKSCKIR